MLAAGSRWTWTVSAAAHVSLLAIAQFGLPHFFDEPDPTPVVIPVEVVDIGAMTSPPEPAAPEPTPEPEPKPAAAPPPPPQAVPEPPQAAPAPEVAAVPAPPPPAPEKPNPKPEPPKAEPQKVPETRIARAAPVSKPKPPEKKTPPKPTRDFNSLLKDLAATEPKDAPKVARKAEAPDKQGAPAPVQSRVSDIATKTEIDELRVSIRSQIEPCWSPPIGAREAEDLTVKIVVYLEPTGQVRRAEILDAGRMARNPFFEAAADSARRAVLNDRCNPLKNLPTDRYDLWQELELTFNPKDALG